MNEDTIAKCGTFYEKKRQLPWERIKWESSKKAEERTSAKARTMKNKANFNNSEWTRKVDLKLYLRQNHLEGLFIHWDLPPELLIQDI